MPYSNRKDMFTFALNLEDLETDELFKKYEMKGVKIDKIGSMMYSLRLKHFLPQEYRDNCRVSLKYDKLRYVGTLEMIRGTLIYFHLREREVNCDLLYDVNILPNRVPIMHCQNACEFATTKNLDSYLATFENPPAQQTVKIKSDFKMDDFQWCNGNVAKNQEQKQAVQNIVNCTAFPFPFVVFGPPGTGKTTTLVEAIVQVIAKKPDNKILITCQSNSACDEIGVRLLKYLPRSKIFRWYSASLIENSDKLDPVLKSTSTIRNDVMRFPSYEEFAFFDIVICTLVTSKKLHRAVISPKFFDYIFIDECASTVEPECLIPITGELKDLNKNSSTI